MTKEKQQWELEIPEYALAVRDEYREFVDFMTDAWTALGLESPTRRQMEIAEFMQYGGDAIFIAGQRGIGKSWIAGAYGCWRLIHDFSCNVFTMSASKEKADELSLFAKKLFASERLPHLHFMLPKRGQRDNASRWDIGMAPNQQMPSWRAIGVDGQVQGSRSNVTLLDDVETLANSRTPAARDILLRQASDAASTVKPDDPTGQVIWLGTFQSTDSMYRELSERGVTMRMWPSRFPKPDEVGAYRGMLAPSIRRELRANPGLASSGIENRGAPVDPERFSDEFLLSRERLIGRSQYRLQFQLDPSLADLDKFPLRCENIPVADLDADGIPEEFRPSTREADEARELPCLGHSGDKFYRPASMNGPVIPFKPMVCAIDPSGKGGDETAWVIAGAAAGRMFALEWGGRTDGASERTLTAIARACKKWGVHEVVVEKNFGGGTWTELLKGKLREVYPCSIKEVHAKGKKEFRIADVLEPAVQQKKIIFNAREVQKEFQLANREELPVVGRQKCLVHQVTHLQREPNCLKFDDRVDALAIAAQHLQAHIGLDTQAQLAKIRDARLEDELKKWREGILGRGKDRAVWATTPWD